MLHLIRRSISVVFIIQFANYMCNMARTWVVVEYHNEDFSSRAAEKIKKYEHVYEEGYWRDQWHLDKFPPILIVTTHRAPALGYRKDITLRQKGMGVRCNYLIKPLRTFLDGSQSPLVWLDLDKNRTVNLLNL